MNYHPDWDRVSTSGKGDKKYKIIYCPDHPHAWPNGYVYLHRIVMEQKLGRLLTEKEIVHHKNENGQDDSPDNLELLGNQKEHSKKHVRPTAMVKLVCGYCGKKFSRSLRVERGRTGRLTAYCGYSCNGKANGVMNRFKVDHVEVPHGTRVGYGYHKCRCPLCRKANAVAMRKYRIKRPVARADDGTVP